MAMKARVVSPGSVWKITCEIYSLPTSATPDIDAALEMRMMQLMENAIEG
jgi:hypothetical protein